MEDKYKFFRYVSLELESDWSLTVSVIRPSLVVFFQQCPRWSTSKYLG